MIGAAELANFDKWLGEHLKTGLAKELIATVALAAGGKVEITAAQIEALMGKNVMVVVERTALGWMIAARERPKCRECGQVIK